MSFLFDIMVASSVHTVHVLFLFLQWIGDVNSATSTSFEPTGLFTPTTLANLESRLMDFDSQMEYGGNEFSDSSMSNDAWDQSSAKRSRTSESLETSTVTTTRRLPGPKSSTRFEDMTPEERNRRQRRRERNKAAAARCRQRRVDLTNELETVSFQILCPFLHFTRNQCC